MLSRQAPEVKRQAQTDRLGFIGEIRTILFILDLSEIDGEGQFDSIVKVEGGHRLSVDRYSFPYTLVPEGDLSERMTNDRREEVGDIDEVFIDRSCVDPVRSVFRTDKAAAIENHIKILVEAVFMLGRWQIYGCEHGVCMVAHSHDPKHFFVYRGLETIDSQVRASFFESDIDLIHGFIDVAEVMIALGCVLVASFCTDGSHGSFFRFTIFDRNVLCACVQEHLRRTDDLFVKGR